MKIAEISETILIASRKRDPLRPVTILWTEETQILRKRMATTENKEKRIYERPFPEMIPWGSDFDEMNTARKVELGSAGCLKGTPV